MLVQNHLRNRKEHSDREDELRGLLRLVDVEMSDNEDILQAAIAVNLTEASGAQVTPIVALRDLEAADWDRTKVRLARLADADHFAKLHEYYKGVTETSMRVHQIASRSDFSNRQLGQAQALAQDCKTVGDVARSRSKAVLSNNTAP